MRSTRHLRQSAKPPTGWKGKFLNALSATVHKYVPDPRNDPMSERPVGYEDFKSGKNKYGFTESDPNESLEDFMKKRNENWVKRNMENLFPGDGSKDRMEEAGYKRLADGSVWRPTGDKAKDANVDVANEKLPEVITESLKIDEEKQKLRRQLQVENAEEYRKFVAEMKRSELQEQQTMRRRAPHPADPKYDPFKHTPGYRPQDSEKLASWLKRQRESGITASGASLSTREGQERFYNEEKMATQYHANPFSSHIEVARGLPKMTITHLSPDSICIDDKEIIGSIIVSPTRYFHWNATTIEDVNVKSLSLLLHLYPVPDVVFIGTGRNLYMIDEELRLAFQKRGTVVHTMTTREACSTFSLQLTIRRRVACALLACVPTNGYGKECFGDFIENDSYCMSDTQLGIPTNRQFNPALYRTSKVAEQYRKTVGTGVGPNYHILSDGRMVRPGTSGTKLRPMLEPGDNVEWEKLPSYYHWFPKETIDDYIQNNTWRDVQGLSQDMEAERRMKGLHAHGQPISDAPDEQPKADLMPWDSATIPLPKWQYEKNETGEVCVEDPKTGRVIGMHKNTFKKWQDMMERRKSLDDQDKEADPHEEDVEYDQEHIVTDRDGRLMDFSKMKYVPMNENRWHPRKQSSTQRGNVPLPQ